MTKTIAGLFDQPSEAKRAAQELRSKFARDDVAITNGASDAAALRMLQQGDLPADDVEFFIAGVQNGGTLVVVRAADTKAQHATDILATFDTVESDVSRFAAYEVDFRAHHAANLLSNDNEYTQYRSAYRYGYDLGIDDRYRTGDWPMVEVNARRIWEQRNALDWEHVEDRIHYAWEAARSER